MSVVKPYPKLSPKVDTKMSITKQYRSVELLFEVSVLPNDVRIHKISICGRDIFHIIDPEIRRAAYEEFKSQLINAEI